MGVGPGGSQYGSCGSLRSWQLHRGCFPWTLSCTWRIYSVAFIAHLPPRDPRALTQIGPCTQCRHEGSPGSLHKSALQRGRWLMMSLNQPHEMPAEQPWQAALISPIPFRIGPVEGVLSQVYGETSSVTLLSIRISLTGLRTLMIHGGWQCHFRSFSTT